MKLAAHGPRILLGCSARGMREERLRLEHDGTAIRSYAYYRTHARNKRAHEADYVTLGTSFRHKVCLSNARPACSLVGEWFRTWWKQL